MISKIETEYLCLFLSADQQKRWDPLICSEVDKKFKWTRNQL